MPDQPPTIGTSAPSSSEAPSSAPSSSPAQSSTTPESLGSAESSPSSNQSSSAPNQTVGEALAAFEGAGRFGQPDSATTTTPESRQRGPDGKFVSTGVAAITASQAQASQTPAPGVQQSLPQSQAQNQGYRDYTGLNAEDKLIFERMSNEGFSKLKPLYLDAVRVKAEHDRLAKENADIQSKHFYEQPDAYQLTDQYRALSANATTMNAEVGHYQSQLQVLEQALIDFQTTGEWPATQISELVGGPNGEVMISNTPFNVDKTNLGQARSFVLSKLTEAHNLQQQLSQQIGGYKAKFQAEHEKYTSSFSSLEAKIFGDQLPVVEKAMKSKLDLFPSHTRGRADTKFAAKLLVLLDGYNMLLQQRQGQQNTQNIVNRTAASGGPVTAGAIAPVNTNGHNTVGQVMDDLERMKRSGWQ